MNIFDVEVEPPLEQQVRSVYDNTHVGQVVEVYGTNKRMDGTTFPVHVRFAKLDDEFAIANVRDITQQKEAEEVRKRWTEETAVMAEIGRVISSSLEINDVFNLLGEEIRKLIPFDRMTLSMFEQEGEVGGRVFTVAGSKPSLDAWLPRSVRPSPTLSFIPNG